MSNAEDDECQKEDLKGEVTHILEEARMVIPGIQALFGFQLMAVFNQGFSEKLTQAEQTLHLVALSATASALVLLMAPAAYHRQVEPDSVSREFVNRASWFITWGMAPLAFAICLDIKLISRAILKSPGLSLMISLVM